MKWLMIEEDIMRNRRAFLAVFSLIAIFLFLVSCSQAYSAGQREPEQQGSLMSQPVK